MALRAGLIGFGTVGAGTVKTLFGNAEQIARRAGAEIQLAGIADLDLERDRGVDVSSVRMTADARELTGDPGIDVIIELVGGCGIAKEIVLSALENGKEVVTANKALLADKGAELFEAAARLGRRIYFEGAVGGGIPFIQSLYGGLASAKIGEIHAIINGTCNYILTEMERRGAAYGDVLAEAQRLGYAELDPAFDVGGIDAAHKIAITASICFNTAVPLGEVHTEGISDITAEDIEFGRRLGYRLKLLAIAKDHGADIEVRVHPTFIPEAHLLASVNGVYNAVCANAPGMGSTVLYGRGAGDMPTGHAVVSDLIQCARERACGRGENYANFYTFNKKVRPVGDISAEYYLRFVVRDRPGVLARIAGALGGHGISILSVLQTEAGRGADNACPVVIMTHEARESNLRHALDEIGALDFALAPAKVIRIEAMDSER